MKIVTTSGLKRALGVVVGTITEALRSLQGTLSGAVEAEATARRQADALLMPRDVAAALLSNLASYANGTTVLLRKQSVTTASGAVEDIYEAMPVVDEDTAGICPPTVYCQVLQTARDVDALKCRRAFYPTEFDTDSPTDAQLAAVVEAAGGELLDGVTVTDFTYHKDYTWYAATGAWRDRGSSVVAVATNAAVGAVRGRNQPGYCAVDPDGSLPLVGWDATQEAISALQAGAAMKSGIPQFVYSMGHFNYERYTEWLFHFMSPDGGVVSGRQIFVPLCTDTNNGDFKMRKVEVDEINIVG